MARSPPLMRSVWSRTSFTLRPPTDVPGAVNGTGPSGINPVGTIVGFYNDANFNSHSFLRSPKGIITPFDPPGSSGSNAVGINPAGAIVGSYAGTTVSHGFLRAPDGTFTTLDPPDSAGTGPNGINPEGAITGSYFDANGALHGFLFLP